MTNAPSATQPVFTPSPPAWTITVNGVTHLYREINGRLVRIHDKAANDTPQA